MSRINIQHCKIHLQQKSKTIFLDDSTIRIKLKNIRKVQRVGFSPDLEADHSKVQQSCVSGRAVFGALIFRVQDTSSGTAVGAGGRFWPILATRGLYRDHDIYKGTPSGH